MITFKQFLQEDIHPAVKAAIVTLGLAGAHGAADYQLAKSFPEDYLKKQALKAHAQNRKIERDAFVVLLKKLHNVEIAQFPKIDEENDAEEQYEITRAIRAFKKVYGQYVDEYGEQSAKRHAIDMLERRYNPNIRNRIEKYFGLRE